MFCAALCLLDTRMVLDVDALQQVQPRHQQRQTSKAVVGAAADPLGYGADRDGSKTSSDRPPSDVLWVLEQLPGHVEAADVTSVLLGQGYWASFNVPYFADVYHLAGRIPACGLRSGGVGAAALARKFLVVVELFGTSLSTSIHGGG
jgi:hypothetical protein